MLWIAVRVLCTMFIILIIGCAAPSRLRMSATDFEGATALPQWLRNSDLLNSARDMLACHSRQVAGRLLVNMDFVEGIRLEVLQPGGTQSLTWFWKTPGDLCYILMASGDNNRTTIEELPVEDGKWLSEFVRRGNIHPDEVPELAMPEVSDPSLYYFTFWSDGNTWSYVVHQALFGIDGPGCTHGSEEYDHLVSDLWALAEKLGDFAKEHRDSQ